MGINETSFIINIGIKIEEIKFNCGFISFQDNFCDQL